MSINSKVDIFTTAMRTEFQVAYAATAAPAPWEQVTQVVPSTARIEHYTWMSPTPGMAQWAGHRRYGKVDTVRYSVENLEFDAAFEVQLRDIEDDQTGGYMTKPKELAARAKNFPGRWVTKHLAAGETRACFDGSYFFADSHTLGTGDNLRSKNCASNDAATFNLAFLYTGGPLKPLLWQNRKPPRFENNGGTPQSLENKVVRYWVDLEGEAAYGYWWDAVWFNVTDTPTVTEMHEIFAEAETAFRSFQLPKANSSEDGEYVHEQTVFSADNLMVVGSTGLAETLRQALQQDWVPQAFGATPAYAPTTNRFKGWANYYVSAFMN